MSTRGEMAAASGPSKKDHETVAGEDLDVSDKATNVEHNDESNTSQNSSDLPKRSLKQTFKRVISEAMADDITDRAAALTYYAVLSIFPALLVVVSIIGLIGDSATQPLIENLTDLAPGTVSDILTNALHDLEEAQSAAGILALIGLATALWSASAYVGAFIRASNIVYDVPEGRPMWKKILTRLGITVLAGIILMASATIVVFTGTLAEKAGEALGLGSSAVAAWDILKWPVLVLAISFLLAVMYWAAPNARQPRFRLITPGSMIAVILWLAASAGFAVYVANFGSYNKTYGTLAGPIIFLVWLWISNLAVLLGAEINSEFARNRAIAAGNPVDKEPYMQLRDDRNLDDKSRKEYKNL